MPTETRYFRNQTQTVNGLTSYMLALSKYGVAYTLGYSRAGAYLAGDLGVRVYKRAGDGTETEITAGAPVAIVMYEDGDFRLEQSNTWNCPSVSLNPTDSIVVRVYARIPSGTGTWTLMTGGVFSTEQLGASQLNSATWTVYYVGSFIYDANLRRAGISFHFDGNYNSRIENFSWSVPVALPKIMRLGANITVQPHAIILVKRNGNIIAYRKPHMPFKPEKPIQPVVE